MVSYGTVGTSTFVVLTKGDTR